MEMILEEHLGGFFNTIDPATYTPNLWKYISQNFGIQSVIDVGCGMGYSLPEFEKYCDDVVGIEGSVYVYKHSPYKSKIIFHDFTKGPLDLKREFDLCWSCEFVEHVEEKFADNFLKTFETAKYLAMTYADVGQHGHHHVNCQNKEYWIDMIENYGFKFDEEWTNTLKQVTLRDAVAINPQYMDNHFYNRGLFFYK